MKNITRLTQLTLVAMGLLRFCEAQATIDWSTKKFSSCPSSIAPGNGKLDIEVTNLNTILYRYDISVSDATTPLDVDNFSNISGFFKGTGEAAPVTNDPCPGLVQTLKDAASQARSEFTKLSPRDASGSLKSIPLDQTLKDWNAFIGSDSYKKFVNALQSLQANKDCAAKNQTDVDQAITLQRDIDNFRDAVRTSTPNRKTSAHLTPNAKNSITAHITEYVYDGGDRSTVSTQDIGPCDVSVNVLTLSAGVLVSTIAGQDYVSVKSSTVPSTNILVVQDARNIQPNGLFLLNYDVPKLSGQSVGATISAGPTYRLAGPSNTSNFGFFAGGGGHLWRYFFVTIGVHLGEFADFPAGFGSGSIIPADYGALTPLKRWTIKPGFAITFQTKSFNTQSKSAGTQSTTPPAKTATSPTGNTGGGTSAAQPNKQPVSETPSTNSAKPSKPPTPPGSGL